MADDRIVPRADPEGANEARSVSLPLEDESTEALAEIGWAANALGKDAWLNRGIISLLIMIAVVAVGSYLIRGDVLIASFQSQAAAAPDGVGVKVGKIAPDFMVTDLGGKVVRLSDFRGQPVMVNFWATWCPPCRAEAPEIENIYRERQGQGLAILGVSMDDDATAVPGFVSQFGLTFPIAVDADSRVADLYRVDSIPMTFFIDKNGVIRDIQLGQMDRNIILKKLASIM